MDGEMHLAQYNEGSAGKKSVRVLLVDDSAKARNGLRALLSTIHSATPINEAQLAFEIIGEASNGREAVQLVAKHQPDAVLLDAQMPEMDGLEVTRMIKKQWPKVRVVMLTMYAKYEIEALQAGIDSFLVKGCPTADLLNALTAAKID
jgi:DNA-binding NarL/FixJ family response regulator